MGTTFRIAHETNYAFSKAVYLFPHYLRFKPRSDSRNTLQCFSLEIQPNPSKWFAFSDVENNDLSLYHFQGYHTGLDIRAYSEITTSDLQLLDSIIYPENYVDMPINYSMRLKSLLGATLFTSAIGAPLLDFGKSILESTFRKTLDFIHILTERIYNDFVREFRLEGSPYDADQTFYRQRGSCRDLAWMQIELLRNMGIAARYVSGYYFMGLSGIQHDLHAWIEAYIPGAGWVGFDPSNGCRAGSKHVPICSSAYYQNTMPVTGAFKGAVNSSLNTSVTIELIRVCS